MLLIAPGFAQQSPPVATVTPASARFIRISFVPPPLEGKISLGIYNEWGQLVRVLHEQAELNEFTIGPDALVTKWDGKDDWGYDLPPGKYSARGFIVGAVKIDETTPVVTADSVESTGPVRVRLVANPLERNERPTVELVSACDEENACIATIDGLPLMPVADTGEADGACTLVSGKDKSLRMVLQIHGTTREFRIAGINNMMAFDCGEFELK